jgi:phosphatidylglycerol---prolipoprotein diacylglyceryl transferase
MIVDPIAFSVGPLVVHWYGLMYVLAFILGGVLLYYQTRHDPIMTAAFRQEILVYSGWGVIIGGRLGYVFFYGWSYWLQDFWWPFRLWEPGMSFHGGCLGVIIALLFLCRRRSYSFLPLMDYVAPCVPLGLFCGRMGNFINGELWGKPTDHLWGMVFPQADLLLRHPSPLYEGVIEGLLLFLLLWACVVYKKKYPDLFPPGRIAGLFLILYGIFRFILEYWREPDPQFFFLIGSGVSMGQLLSIPMVLVGGWLICRGI